MSASDTDVRKLAETVADTSSHPSVKRFYLDNSRGLLNSTAPVNLLREDENIRFTFYNGNEGVEGTFDGVEDFTPGAVRGTLLVVTDERVLVLLGKENRDIAIEIPYGAIEEADFDVPLFSAEWLGLSRLSRIHIDTSEDRYTVPVKATRADVTQLVSHIKECCESVIGGEVQRFEPEMDYQQPRKTPRPEYRTIPVCRKCVSEVSKEVERCPHCGFDPQEKTRGATWKVGSGILSMSPLAPIGVAMGYDSAKKSQNSRRGVWIEKKVEVDEDESSD